ncbi:glucose-methanol-choline oxidoreductase [Tieghemostelium lacteum]|uniref:Long-chain-alcohol oxidase n=1 Tax=Tieghemostelium lacteum TaxID=361077 RepID=A0A151ZDP0_TIELA|nr:glucose-methanol-choline oxidoreductase [Tieghemostelium lacteum]|eukprot:KYQ92076.1 glucose-methanol-choline oxidoreductase [Tieghemostelium lacteum]
MENNGATPPQGQDIKGSFHLLPTGIFTLKEYQTLQVIIDTLISNDLSEYEQTDIPSNLSAHKLTELKEYYHRTGTDLDLAYQFMKLIIMTKTRSQISDLKTLLSLFSTSGFGAILTGSITNFCFLPLKTRQKILSSMKSSSNGTRRQAYRAIVPLVFTLFATVITTHSETNPNWEALGYQRPPPLEQIPGEEKLSFITVNSDRSFSTDVVVIGSGAGGGVTASLLAKAGYKVLILEKGGYLSPNNMTWKESEAFPQLYEQAGTLTSDDLSVNILAGSCLGGGTTVNWTASVRTPDHILDEWRKDCPNTFANDKFQEALNTISERINVNTQYSTQSTANQLLKKGLDDLQLESSVIARNVKDCDTTQCGFCSMGCRTKSKQSSTVTYLEDACADGAQIITNCFVEEITKRMEPSKGSDPQQQMECVHGVVGTVQAPDGSGRYRIFVKANIIVASAGAIHTPALLLRSRIKNNNIGSNFYLHPVCPVIGMYDQQVEVWKGPPMTVVSKAHMKTPTSNYGTILEVPNAHIGLSLAVASCQWAGSFDFKTLIQSIDRWNVYIPILRDSTPGKIKLDKDQRTPKIIYKLSEKDWKNMMPGIESSIRALHSTGAVKILLPCPGLPVFQSSHDDINQYIQTIKSLKYKPNGCSIVSAHQMGSCRMGSSRSNSVVNEQGESWDLKRLFISDGSVFPSALGVNPMLTIYATSYIIAKNIISLYPPSNISFESSTSNATTTQ